MTSVLPRLVRESGVIAVMATPTAEAATPSIDELLKDLRNELERYE
jgi:hypothetical protein